VLFASCVSDVTQVNLKKSPASNNRSMDVKIHAPAIILLYKLDIRITWLYISRAYLKIFCQITDLYVVMIRMDVGSRFGIPHFFLPPLSSPSLRSQVTTLPSITTPLPSMKATRDRPSQFLKVSHTKGCCGWKLH